MFGSSENLGNFRNFVFFLAYLWEDCLTKKNLICVTFIRIVLHPTGSQAIYVICLIFMSLLPMYKKSRLNNRRVVITQDTVYVAKKM